MKQLQFKHFFKVEKGVFKFEDEQMFEFKRKNFEGKRGYAIIEEVKEEITPNQYAYYFGGIIRRECMVSDIFSGLTEMQIHSILFEEIRSTIKAIQLADGTTKLVTIPEDFSKYSKEDMRKYIDELIPHLQVTYNIHPKPPSHYKYNKFYMDPKIYKHELEKNS